MSCELKERILKDLEKFNDSLFRLKSSGIEHALNDDEKRVLSLANRYFDDSKYFLSKGDYPTSFGCITYAHGLLDSILIIRGLK